MARIEHYEFGQIVVDASRSGTTCSSCRIGWCGIGGGKTGMCGIPRLQLDPSSAPGAPASPAPLDLPRGVVVVVIAPDRDSDRRSGGGGPAGGRRCYRSAERHLNRSGPLTSRQWGSGSGPARLCWPSSAGSPACTRSENDPHSRAASKQAVPEIARGARRQRVGPQGKALQSIAPLGLLPATIAGWVATWPRRWCPCGRSAG
jgi:hypothetical protein